METGVRLNTPAIIHGTYEFIRKDGRPKAVPYSGYPISDVTALPLGASDAVERTVGEQWARQVTGRHFPVHLGSSAEARRAVKTFEFPEELRHNALRYAARLAWILNEEAGPRFLRRQEHGRFDPNASGRMLTAVRGGTYSAESVRPFIRQHRQSPRRPHVGIVAAGNWSAMWKDEHYIPNTAMLSLAVSWACEALGCLTTSAILRNVMDGHFQNKRHLGVYWLSRPDATIPLTGYAAIFHRELYRCGTTLLEHAHPYHVQIAKGMTEEQALQWLKSGEVNESADEKFRGVAWARSQGASIVVGIGDFKDKQDADVRLDAGLKLEEAIDAIAEQLAKQKRMAA